MVGPVTQREPSSRFELSSRRHVRLGGRGGVEQQRWSEAVAEPGACGAVARGGLAPTVVTMPRVEVRVGGFREFLIDDDREG
jgi:hypothetical protein